MSASAAPSKPLSRPNAAVPAALSTAAKKPSSLPKSETTRETTKALKKKKKKHSPFRIKAGCLVALRYRAGGNTFLNQKEAFSGDYSEVWTDPLQGRDDGLALVGRRVRCCFPKSVLTLEHKAASTRFVEGEIVSLIDYENQWLQQKEQRRRRQCCYTSVELLVDRRVLQELPFLERTDEDVDTSSMSATEKKRHGFEEVIRGKNTVTVQVHLGDASGISLGKETADGAIVAKWVIRKRVKLPGDDAAAVNGSSSNAAEATPENGTNGASKTNPKAKTSSKASHGATLYFGNGKDPQPQQERNWRWLAGRYDDMMLSDGDCTGRPEHLSFGMTGEVLRVTPAAVTNGKPTSLATVTLQRMLLPEHCRSGRLSRHGAVEIFDERGVKSNGTTLHTYQVPVEECVIIARKFKRRHKSATNGGQNAGVGLNCPVVTKSYSFRTDSYHSLVRSETSDSVVDDEVTSGICHRCRNTMGKGEVDLLGNQNKITCRTCKTSRPGKASDDCDCRSCRSYGESHQDTRYKARIEKAFRDFHLETDESGLDATRAVPEECVVCGKACKSESRCESCTSILHTTCAKWDQSLDQKEESYSDDETFLCRACRNEGCGLREGTYLDNHIMASACSVVQAICPCDFDLPPAFMDIRSLPAPSEKPLPISKRRGRPPGKKTVRRASGTGKTASATKKPTQTEVRPAVVEVKPKPNDDENKEEVFVPSCSRIIPYEPSKKRFSGAPKGQKQVDDSSAPGSPGGKVSPRTTSSKSSARKRKRESDRGVVENKASSRAARANQRRMMKGVAALGASGLGLDTLAGREQQLRFDRSSIHAWGVFADESINAGDMIVEYRGELIGNAVAEKREKEYEKAKIGSDYMFRIDGSIVCDATKQGNVARFINASCDPNCYTQIITLNGVKRIVIYAKKDIPAGRELCYDYKFPFEFDESKRIPCHCGARECRGFMNWDKRYVALPGHTLGAAEGTVT